jgi:hypothetical protein
MFGFGFQQLCVTVNVAVILDIAHRLEMLCSKILKVMDIVQNNSHVCCTTVPLLNQIIRVFALPCITIKFDATLH